MWLCSFVCVICWLVGLIACCELSFVGVVVVTVMLYCELLKRIGAFLFCFFSFQSICASTAGLATLFGFAVTDLNQLSILKFIPNFMEIKHEFVTESGCVVEIHSSTGIVSCNIKIVPIEVDMDLMQVDISDAKALLAPKNKVISPQSEKRLLQPMQVDISDAKALLASKTKVLSPQSEKRLLQPLSPAPIGGAKAPVPAELMTTTPGNANRTIQVPSSPNPAKSPGVLLQTPANNSLLTRVPSSGLDIFVSSCVISLSSVFALWCLTGLRSSISMINVFPPQDDFNSGTPIEVRIRIYVFLFVFAAS